MEEKLIRQKRDSEGHLFLQVLQDNNWVSYTQAVHRRPDYDIPGVRNSKGFATAQKYLELGYKYTSYQNELIMSYVEVFTEFLEEKISVDRFQEVFLSKFKEEDSFSSDKEFHILDTLFGYVDAYWDEKDELFDPEDNITEEQLREVVKQKLVELKK